ncbi:MAG TPA: ribosome maturation factor RimM [Steroidobacteraceae bacterium]|nr:ribosome maturation factor RimM [Steroidobacteraceae bacterium]
MAPPSLRPGCASESWLELGRIGAPFGLAGWVHVSSHTDPPEALLEYRDWALRPERGERQRYRLIEGQVQGKRLIARLEGIESRDGAALLTGARVEIERAELPPTGDREYYRADLIGLEVENLEGVALGRVAYFIDAPAGVVMVVEDLDRVAPGERAPADRREHWVLAIPAHLRRVDLAARRIWVDWPAELK